MKEIWNAILKFLLSKTTLDEKITGIDKRLDNQEFINRGILVGIILALFAGVVKLFGFFPNPNP